MSLNPYIFAVPPDDHLSVNVLFNDYWENTASLVNLADPKVALMICNNYLSPDIYPRSYSFHNTQPTAQVFLLHCGFKKGPPNYEQPWNDSQPVQAAYSGYGISINYYTTEPRVIANIAITIALGTKSLPSGDNDRCFAAYASPVKSDSGLSISDYLAENEAKINQLISIAKSSVAR